MANKAVVVLGGGISGLSCAYYLQKLCKNVKPFNKIIVLESSGHLGGWLKTVQFEDGVRHELGPRSIRVQTNPGFNTLNLAEELGLADEVIGTSMKSIVSKKRQILVNNQLVVLPSKLTDLFRKTKPFSKRLMSYLYRDLRTPKLDLSRYGNDISVYDFIERRLGPEIADYVIDPMCRGITAGNAKKLSLISLFPQILRAEQEFGSIFAGSLLNQQRDNFQFYSSPLVTKAKQHLWSTYTFKEGIQALPNRLCEYMLELDGKPIEIYNESTVNRIEFNNTSNTALINISTQEERNIEIEADYVFSSIPAQNLAKILTQNEYKDLSEALNGITTVHMAVVNLEFKGKVMADDSGFGFLVPSSQNSKILGIIYDSCVTPELNAGQDITRLTVMIGGEWFEEVLGDVHTVDPQTALDYALEAVRSHLNINEDPIRNIVSINKNCIPQYYLGHRQRLELINQLIRKYSLNMSLIGSSYQGFSVPDCIYYAKLAAEGYADAHRRISSSHTKEELDSNLQTNQSIQ